ncbi:helicase C-terminal domain-containing protein [Anaeromassilibacillus sp. SJQ-1]
MNEVYRVFRELYPQVDTLLQTSGMTEEARGEFLEQFDVARPQTLLGFCVLGGIYAEGIDLRGERLIGTAIVGVGLPQVNAEQEILRTYYDRINGAGFPFAYQYPGMNKVLQAAGRVIRSEQDRGIVLLIDSRFSTASYRELFPLHWQHARTVRSVKELEQVVTTFWQS